MYSPDIGPRHGKRCAVEGPVRQGPLHRLPRYVEKKARDIHPDNCSERRTEHYRAVSQSLGLDISPPTKQVGPVGPKHRWPEGYRRPRDLFTLVMEIVVVTFGRTEAWSRRSQRA